MHFHAKSQSVGTSETCHFARIMEAKRKQNGSNTEANSICGKGLGRKVTCYQAGLSITIFQSPRKGCGKIQSLYLHSGRITEVGQKQRGSKSFSFICMPRLYIYIYIICIYVYIYTHFRNKHVNTHNSQQCWQIIPTPRGSILHPPGAPKCHIMQPHIVYPFFGFWDFSCIFL